MIIPRILEIERRNRRKLADGTVKMNEIIKVAASRLMVQMIDLEMERRECGRELKNFSV